jgi:hypothetical protein
LPRVHGQLVQLADLPPIVERRTFMMLWHDRSGPEVQILALSTSVNQSYPQIPLVDAPGLAPWAAATWAAAARGASRVTWPPAVAAHLAGRSTAAAAKGL